MSEKKLTFEQRVERMRGVTEDLRELVGDPH